MHKYIVSVLLSCLLSGMLCAQPVPIPLDTLPFAHFKDNRFVFDADNAVLCAFYTKFDSVVSSGNGNINIVHIGGSHVQAGTLSHRIRTRLLHAFPDRTGGRGMIFPYSAAKRCNNPHDYRISKEGDFGLIRNVYANLERPLGVTGIAVYTADSVAEIKIQFREDDVRFETDRITLLGLSDYRLIVPAIQVDTTIYLPVEIDTVTRRYVYEVEPFTESFLIRFPVDSGNRFTLTGVLLDNSRPGITFHSLGVNGASVASYLKCDYFSEDMKLLQPDMVIFGLGINDASGSDFDTLEFIRNYKLLTEKIREVNPDCAFVFITNNDSYKRVARGKYSVNKRGPVVQKLFYRIAAETGGAVWDQFHIMGGLRSMDKWRMEGFAKTDRVHFTNKGYNLLGDLFYNAFIQAYFQCTDLHTLKRPEIEEPVINGIGIYKDKEE